MSASPGPRRLVVPPGALGERPYRVVFVCTGNICRSPMAEVITRSIAASTELGDHTTLGDHLDVASAGTGPWHEGEPMHELASEALARAGYPRHPHLAHQVVSSQLGQIDLVVALDRRHQQTLRAEEHRVGWHPQRTRTAQVEAHVGVGAGKQLPA